MPPDERDAAYLWDMLAAARGRQLHFFTSGISFAAYLQDRMRQRAIERAIEIIGEAATLRVFELQTHPTIPWHPIIAQHT